VFRPFKSMVSPSDVWRQVAASEGKSGQAPDGIALFGLDNKRVREEIKNASKYDCCARPLGRGAPFRAHVAPAGISSPWLLMYAPHARIPVASQAQEQGSRSQSERCAVKKLTAATERKQRGEQRGQARGWLGGTQEWARGAEEVGAAQDIYLTAVLSSRCAQTTSLSR